MDPSRFSVTRHVNTNHPVLTLTGIPNFGWNSELVLRADSFRRLRAGSRDVAICRGGMIL